MTHHHEQALDAAGRTALATAALLQLRSEGSFDDVDVVALLAQALATACDIRIDQVEECDTTLRAALTDLATTARGYAVRWAE